MELSKKPKLENQIIQALSTSESLTVAELMEAIGDGERACSLPTLYRELAKLRERGVIVKVKEEYRLKLTWIVNLYQFAKETYEAQLTQFGSQGLIPAPGKSLTWHFTDLDRIDDFWEQVLFALFQTTEQRELIGWIPHPWFHLSNNVKQIDWLSATKAAGVRVFRLIGGRTFLDTCFAPQWTDPVAAVSFEKSPFDDQRSLYFDVLDDYIFSIKFSPRCTEMIEELYATVDSFSDENVAKIDRFVSTPVNAKVTLEHNTEKAADLRDKLYGHWGMLPEQRVYREPSHLKLVKA